MKCLGNRFLSRYLESNLTNEDEAKNRLELAVTLFYKFIENILQNEKTIRKDISVSKDFFVVLIILNNVNCFRHW